MGARGRTDLLGIIDGHAQKVVGGAGRQLYRKKLGVRTRGLRRISPPLAPLVGTNASITLAYLGKDITLNIDPASGATVACWTDSREPLALTDA